MHGERHAEVVEFLVRSQDMIQGYAYGIVRDFNLADDIYQEVSVIVLDRWETLRKGRRLKSWVCEVTRRKALELLRKTNARAVSLPTEVLDTLAEAFHSDEAADAPERNERDIIAQCIQELKGTARRIIESRYRDDLPCDAIAKRIGRSIQSIYAILKRARLALAECHDRKLRESVS